MKRIKMLFLIAAGLIILYPSINSNNNTINTVKDMNLSLAKSSAISDDLEISVPGSCTIFSAAFKEKALFGNNEDYKEIPSYCWYVNLPVRLTEEYILVLTP